MKNLSLFFVASLFLSSCTSNTIYKKPNDLISKDSMVILLKDLHIANAARNIKNVQLQRKISYIPLIYKKYQIDSLRFQQSNLYYASKVDEYKSMLNRVIELLKKDRKEYATIKKVKDSIIKDSIQKSIKKINAKKDSLPLKSVVLIPIK